MPAPGQSDPRPVPARSVPSLRRPGEIECASPAPRPSARSLRRALRPATSTVRRNLHRPSATAPPHPTARAACEPAAATSSSPAHDVTRCIPSAPILIFESFRLLRMQRGGPSAYNGFVPKGELSLASTESSCVLVYDVGGSHISCAVCFANGYRLGPIAKANLPETQTSDAFIGVLHSLGKQTAEENGAVGAELAMPGPFDYLQGISRMRHKLLYLYGVNLRNALA